MDSGTVRRPCFIEEDDGLASLAEMEAGVSGKQCNSFVSRPLCSARSGFRNASAYALSSPRSSRFCDARFEDHQPHFLESCFLCKKLLGSNRDIFMYRGDTPFCSEECRQEQIEMDEAKEKNWSLSSSMKAMRNKNDQRKSTSPTRAQDYTFHAGTVAAA